MVFFIGAHLLKNRSGFFVFGRQLFQVLIKVLANLMFCRCDKTEADFIADQAGGSANSEGSITAQSIQIRQKM